MLVVGVDLSLTSTGIARTDGHLDRIRTAGGANADLRARWIRLNKLARDVHAAIPDCTDLIVLEAPSLGVGRQRGTHDRSGLWWLVVDSAMRRQIPIAEVPPALRCRYATGRGNAGKDEVLAAVVRRFADWDVTGNDVADALVLAAMGADHLGHPIVELPAQQRLALGKVAWPAVMAA